MPGLHFTNQLFRGNLRALYSHYTFAWANTWTLAAQGRHETIRHQQPNTLNPDPSPSAQRPDRRRLNCQSDRVLFSRRLSPKSVLPARPPTTHGDLRSEVDLASQTHDAQVVRVTPRRYSSEEGTPTQRKQRRYYPRHASQAPCTRNAPLLETLPRRPDDGHGSSAQPAGTPISAPRFISIRPRRGGREIWEAKIRASHLASG